MASHCFSSYSAWGPAALGAPSDDAFLLQCQLARHVLSKQCWSPAFALARRALGMGWGRVGDERSGRRPP